MDPRLASAVLRQPDQRSCGAATLVMARAVQDPAYAELLLDGRHPVTGHTLLGTLSERFAAEVLAMHRRGVKVRLITDGDKAFDAGSDVHALRNSGVPVALDVSAAHMHHKFAIIDGSWLLNGSYNWTRSACEHNEENVILSNDPSLVRRFADEFDILWKELQAA